MMVELYQTSGLAGKATIADEAAHLPREPMTRESGQVERASQSVILKDDVVQGNSWSGWSVRESPPRIGTCNLAKSSQRLSAEVCPSPVPDQGTYFAGWSPIIGRSCPQVGSHWEQG